MKGKVKFYDEKKGFGFIIGEDEKDYFLHRSQLPKDHIPESGEELSFDVVKTDKGKQAQNIELVGQE